MNTEMNPKLEYTIRTTQLTVVPQGQPLFDERATVVEIEDDGAGEFVSLFQARDSAETDSPKIRLDPGEWPTVRLAVDRLFLNCRPLDVDATREEKP